MNNKVPQINVVFDRRKVASLSKKAAIELRITHNYKQKWISTGIMLYSNQWKDGKIINCSNILEISQTLETLLTEVRQVILEMIQKNNLNIMAISDELDRKRQSKISFIDFCHQRVSVRKYRKSQDTKERYDRFIKHFAKWGKIKEFEDINDKNIIDYDNYLKGFKLKSCSKWNNYHRFLNSFIIDAVAEGHLKRNPYKWINVDRKKNSKAIERCLTPVEFHRLTRTKMPTQSIERVKDLFIFQTYTCLSYSDLKDFDSRMIQEVKGMSVYVGRRIKTTMTFTIPLLSPALDILHKYNGSLPIISNVKYNEYLKIVAQTAGIVKPLSTHWARHTGATILLNEGVPMQIVSKICGHSSTKITEQVYAKLLDETVVEAIQEVEDKI
jgi:site-specific recombinase XerD